MINLDGSRGFEGSAEIAFTPAPLQGAEFEVDIRTAGSITLLLQTLLPAALLAEGPSRVLLLRCEIDGGAAVDGHAVDQLVVWLGLVGGSIRTWRLSDHARASGKAFAVDGHTLRCVNPCRWTKERQGARQSH